MDILFWCEPPKKSLRPVTDYPGFINVCIIGDDGRTTLYEYKISIEPANAQPNENKALLNAFKGVFNNFKAYEGANLYLSNARDAVAVAKALLAADENDYKIGKMYVIKEMHEQFIRKKTVAKDANSRRNRLKLAMRDYKAKRYDLIAVKDGKVEIIPEEKVVEPENTTEAVENNSETNIVESKVADESTTVVEEAKVDEANGETTNTSSDIVVDDESDLDKVKNNKDFCTIGAGNEACAYRIRQNGQGLKFITRKGSGVIHAPNCRWAEMIKISSRIEIGEDSDFSKLAPCKRCIKIYSIAEALDEINSTASIIEETLANEADKPIDAVAEPEVKVGETAKPEVVDEPVKSEAIEVGATDETVEDASEAENKTEDVDDIVVDKVENLDGLSDEELDARIKEITMKSIEQSGTRVVTPIIRNRETIKIEEPASTIEVKPEPTPIAEVKPQPMPIANESKPTPTPVSEPDAVEDETDDDDGVEIDPVVEIEPDDKAVTRRPVIAIAPKTVEVNENDKATTYNSDDKPEIPTEISPLAKQIIKICNHYDIYCAVYGDDVNILTAAGDWKFNYLNRPIVLYHRNYHPNTSVKAKYEYHRQDMEFYSPIDAIIYIIKHDNKRIKMLLDSLV